MKPLSFTTIGLLAAQMAVGGILTNDAPPTEVAGHGVAVEPHDNADDFVGFRFTTIAAFAPDRLRQAALVWAEMAGRADTRFEQKRLAAFKTAAEGFALMGMPTDADTGLMALRRAEQSKVPVFEGYDHNFYAFVSLLGNYAALTADLAGAEGMASVEVDWLFVAAECAFAASKSGVDLYERFLALPVLGAGDPRFATARERLETIQGLDRGLGR
jgi:hypothetical protein